MRPLGFIHARHMLVRRVQLTHMLFDHPSGIMASQERVCQLGCLASSCIDFLAQAVAIDYGEVIAGAGTRGLAAVQL